MADINNNKLSLKISTIIIEHGSCYQKFCPYSRNSRVAIQLYSCVGSKPLVNIDVKNVRLPEIYRSYVLRGWMSN